VSAYVTGGCLGQYAFASNKRNYERNSEHPIASEQVTHVLCHLHLL
jgi:hypothetical protein